MRVIVATCNETDNKRLGSALTELGYNVCGFMDHYWNHRKFWNKILTDGGCSDDFIEMYKDVDVIMEAPAVFFWKEIIDAFPEAKIITTSVNGDDVFDSWYQFIKTVKRGRLYYFMHLLSPCGWRFLTFRKNAVVRGLEIVPLLREDMEQFVRGDGKAHLCDTILESEIGLTVIGFRIEPATEDLPTHEIIMRDS